MKVTKTIEITETEANIIENFLELCDLITDTNGSASMDDVFLYFLDAAELDDNKMHVYHLPSRIIKIDDLR